MSLCRLTVTNRIQPGIGHGPLSIAATSRRRWPRNLSTRAAIPPCWGMSWCGIRSREASMHTIAAAGATGRLGQLIVKALSAQGATVRPLVRPGSPPDRRPRPPH